MVSDRVVDVGEDAGDGGGTHHVLARVLLGHALEVLVLTWRIVWSNALLVDLRISWEAVEKGVELRIKFHDLRSLVNTWLLCDDIQVVLKTRDDVLALPIILNRLNNV